MENIKLEILLEIISDKVWHEDSFFNTEEDYDKIISFNEKRSVVDYFLNKARMVGNAVLFDVSGGGDSEIKAYNYFVLIRNWDYETDVTTWQIIGFDTFKELNEYFVNSCMVIYIFVKDDYTYKEINVEYIVECSNGVTVSLDEREFFCDDEYRREKYKRRIIPKSTCEFHDNEGVYCRCTGSVSELTDIIYMSILANRIIKYEDSKVPYKEDGIVYFEGEEFRYHIEIDNDGGRFKFFDIHGREYCFVRHSFMKAKNLLCKIIDKDCDECEEMFPVDSNVGLIEDMLSNMKYMV